MIKRIPVADLETGMFIADFNTPYLSHPFLPKQRRVRGAKDIDQMLRCGMKEVMIDTSRGRDSSKALGLREVDRQVEKRRTRSPWHGNCPKRAVCIMMPARW
jgi:hypothetical protein